MENTHYTLEEITLLKNENEDLKTQVKYLQIQLELKNQRNAGRKNIPLSIQKEIIEKYHKGVKPSALALDYGYCTATIYHTLKKESSILKQEEHSTDIEFINQEESPKTESIFDYLQEGCFSE